MKQTRKGRGLLVGLALVFFSICLTLLVIEAGFRVYQRFAFGTPLRASLTEESLGKLSPFILDAELGWKSTPNFKWKGMYPNLDGTKYPAELHFDARGFRAFGKVNSTRPKIFVLGDSVTQVVQVSDDKTYHAVMAQTLNAENFAYGVAGYGSLQEYMILDRYYDEIKPDLIVWQFCANDLVNNDPINETNSTKSNNGMTRPYLVNGKVEYILPKRLAFVREFALNYSRALYWVLSRIDQAQANSDAPDVQARMIANGANDPDLQRVAGVTNEIMQKVRARIGTTPVVTFTCAHHELFDQIFRTVSEQNGMLFADSVAIAVERAEQQGTVVRVIDGGHYNEAGNRIIGETLAQFILEKNLLVKP